MNTDVKIALPRTEMSAQEFITLFEQAIFGEGEEAIEAHKKLDALTAEIEYNRNLLLGEHRAN